MRTVDTVLRRPAHCMNYTVFRVVKGASDFVSLHVHSCMYSTKGTVYLKKCPHVAFKRNTSRTRMSLTRQTRGVGLEKSAFSDCTGIMVNCTWSVHYTGIHAYFK